MDELEETPAEAALCAYIARCPLHVRVPAFWTHWAAQVGLPAAAHLDGTIVVGGEHVLRCVEAVAATELEAEAQRVAQALRPGDARRLVVGERLWRHPSGGALLGFSVSPGAAPQEVRTDALRVLHGGQAPVAGHGDAVAAWYTLAKRHRVLTVLHSDPWGLHSP